MDCTNETGNSRTGDVLDFATRGTGVGTLPEAERLEVAFYPDEVDEEEGEAVELAVEELVREAQAYREPPARTVIDPIGYVSNAKNAPSQSDVFQFWAGVEETGLGIGSLVRHRAMDPLSRQVVDTFGVITSAYAHTLGLDDYAVHVYEADARPPCESIQPAPSRRRPVVSYTANVLAATQPQHRPVLSGPVYGATAPDMPRVHGRLSGEWPGPEEFLLGFYEDGRGDYGVFAEERARVLGPKQGHVIFSGLPGAGKTSLFLTLVISLYAHLRRLAGAGQASRPPRVATVAFNVKGADLLFLDHHLHLNELSQREQGEWQAHNRMWQTAGVDTTQRPFGRVIVYTPLASDGLNRHSLRNNPQADQPPYSETREFAFGIQDLWPYLDLFFDNRSGPVRDLLAEIERYFEEKSRNQGFTFAEVEALFKNQLGLPKAARDVVDDGRWKDFTSGTIRAVAQRLRSLPTTLGGLIDVTGKGFGLTDLTQLSPYDMVVIDIERILANPRDPAVAENAIRVITAYVLNRLTELMTQAAPPIDHIIVFADELNRLAPRYGENGIGDYLAQLARTTRDRGIVLFGAGQFRSGIHEDILKAAAVHYSMQTPDYELNDRVYSTLSAEFKARLTRLRPGETLVQYPSLRTSVFARFPRPFVKTGAVRDNPQLAPIPPRPLDECVQERLRRLDTERAPAPDEVARLIQRLEPPLVVQILRDVEMDRAIRQHRETPWEQFSAILHQRTDSGRASEPPAEPRPRSFNDTTEDW